MNPQTLNNNTSYPNPLNPNNIQIEANPLPQVPRLPSRRLVVQPIFVQRKRIFHFNGYIWGEFLYGSRFKASVHSLQLFLSILFTILGISAYDPVGKKKSYDFWIYLILANIFGNLLLLIDIRFHLKHNSEGTSKKILIAWFFDFLFWLLQLFHILALKSNKEIIVLPFYLILLFFSLVWNCNCCCSQKPFTKYKGYFEPLVFIVDVLKFTIVMKAFGIIKVGWPLILLPIMIISYLSVGVLVLSLVGIVIQVLSCSFKCEEFKKNLPRYCFCTYFTVIYVKLCHLDDFEKSGGERGKIIGTLVVNLVISLVLCCMVIRPTTFLEAGQEQRAIRQQSIKRENSNNNNQYNQNNNNNRNQNILGKRYLNFMQIGTTLFSNENKEKEEFQESGNDICVICFDSSPNCISFPCLHGGICMKCSKEALKIKKSCSLCRRALEKIVVYEKDAKGRLFEKEVIMVQRK